MIGELTVFAYIRRHKAVWLLPLGVILALVLTWQIALAQAPQPNQLPPLGPDSNPAFAPLPGADITQPGPAASIHGDPGNGRTLFAQNCAVCHGDRGTDGAVNPGSDDGSVPLLNPIDPGFLEDSHGVAEDYAPLIDLFIQHGSRPNGDDPYLMMPGWGDQKFMTQEQIADVEAYVMSLNGVYWSDRYYPPAEVQMQAVSSGGVVTYTAWVINHAGSPLANWTLQDTLPDGLVPVKAGLIGLDSPAGDGAGQMIATTVNWSNQDTPIPQGGKLGPFIIVARQTDPRQPILPNVAQFIFEFTTADGTTQSGASVVSDPTAPATPTPKPTAAPQPTATAVATITQTATTTVTATAPATPVVTSATPAPASANILAQITEPSASALAWTYDPVAVIAKVGDKVTWKNNGAMAHTVTADDGSFDSGPINPGASWSFTFTTVGVFNYHCTPHPWMRATVIVQK